MGMDTLPALADNWFQGPYPDLLAEAKRVGALVGPSEHAVRWSPDTCKPYRCTLDLVSRGSLIRAIDNKGQVREVFVADPAQDVVAGSTHLLCPFHARLTDPKAHFEVVLAENKLKNEFEAASIVAAPGTREDVPRSLNAMMTVWRRTVTEINAGRLLGEKSLMEGLTVNSYKEGMDYRWEFDADRILIVDVTHLPLDASADIIKLTTAGAKFDGRVRIRG